ncbi:hypothetical protein ABUW04_12545 [Streptacidiphilus sp. N1-10]|uniref:Lipoprotein n=1 Tax=Streptacidiphilus jeojiensis TaxID=3229225 RepID=A0ABV6XLG1_9ACTN
MGTGTRAGRLTLAGALLAGGTAAVVGLAACSSSSSNAGSSASSAAASMSATAAATASFSGEGPSSLASKAASAVAAAESAAASSAAAATAFASSAAAGTAAIKAAATAALAKVEGSGNAMADVGLTGLNRDRTGGLYAAIVNITNRTGSTANFAVQVDFVDGSGKVVDSDVVGAADLAAGQKAQPVAFSTKPSELNLVPRVAKAQHY